MPISRLSHDFSQFEKLKVTQKVLYVTVPMTMSFKVFFLEQSKFLSFLLACGKEI